MAMALASMNSMVGTSTNNGSYFINVLNHDKDLKDDKTSLWGKNYVSNTLDMDDNMIGVDDKGKVKAFKKKEVMNENSELLIYTIKGENIFNLLVEQVLSILYDERDIVGEDFISECVLGHKLLDSNQLDYEPILEKVELEKFSAVISGEADNMKAQFTGLKQTKKNSKYTPDSFPQGTEDMNKIPILNSADVIQRNNILKNYPYYITIYEDAHGFYGYNELTRQRTGSLRDMNKLYLEVLLK